jgi:hypothetical protein
VQVRGLPGPSPGSVLLELHWPPMPALPASAAAAGRRHRSKSSPPAKGADFDRLGRTATGAVSRLENGWVFGPWGFDSLSFRLRRHGRVERQRVANAQGGLPPRRFDPCCLRFRSGVVESARRTTVNQRLAVGEMATPPASGAGDRWFESSRPDCRWSFMQQNVRRRCRRCRRRPQTPSTDTDRSRHGSRQRAGLRAA